MLELLFRTYGAPAFVRDGLVRCNLLRCDWQAIGLNVSDLIIGIKDIPSVSQVCNNTVLDFSPKFRFEKASV